MSCDQTACYWAGTVADFAQLEPRALLEALARAHQSHCHEPASGSQREAWRNEVAALAAATRQLSPDCGVIFEYILPRERGRRPDVILVSRNQALVLEFKDFAAIHSAHVDQVAAYARDLADYQSECRRRSVIPLLVLTKATSLDEDRDGVAVVSADTLGAKLGQLVDPTADTSDVHEFLAGDYAPLPSLVEAARMLFQYEPLPQIRRAESAGIPQTIAALQAYARRVKTAGRNVLALVTGVPGSGKTLVGLQFVYDQSDAANREAVFLSGNGPLVEVLQHVLANKVFVQDVHGFLMEYGGASQRLPEERIWIYDEAQRAWDLNRSREKRGGDALSEPHDFMRLASRVDSGVMIVGLIGEGQEIHIGEEAGIAQWNEAIAAVAEDWTVVCPRHIAEVFAAAADVIIDDHLNLDQSLRTHRASHLQAWVAHLLDGRIEAARDLSRTLFADGFRIYATRRLDSAKRHARERYQGFDDKRYGLVASSKAYNLERHGIPNDFAATRAVRKGPWFGDPPSSPLSCCQLASVATEFACQGLELDFPIVAWGDDLVWDPASRTWRSRSGRSPARDPHQLRLNSYRVLLTRGRDGMVIFVPNEPEMHATFEVLQGAGCRDF